MVSGLLYLFIICLASVAERNKRDVREEATRQRGHQTEEVNRKREKQCLHREMNVQCLSVHPSPSCKQINGMALILFCYIDSMSRHPASSTTSQRASANHCRKLCRSC